MLSKTIKYEDYNGEQREEVFYFNLSKAELTNLELTTVGGLQAMLEKIIAEKAVTNIASFFKELILMSYGEKSADGKRFIKVRDGHKLSEDFEQTEAFSELYMMLATNADEATAFVNGIIPKDLAKEVEKQNKALPLNK